MTPSHTIAAAAVSLGWITTLYFRDKAEQAFIRRDKRGRLNQRRYEFILGWANTCQTLITLDTCERLANKWLRGDKQATAIRVIERRAHVLINQQPRTFSPYRHHLMPEMKTENELYS